MTNADYQNIKERREKLFDISDIFATLQDLKFKIWKKNVLTKNIFSYLNWVNFIEV